MKLAPNYTDEDNTSSPSSSSSLPTFDPFDISIFWILGSLLLMVHYGFQWVSLHMKKVHSSIHLSNMIQLAIEKSSMLRSDNLLTNDVDQNVDQGRE